MEHSGYILVAAFAVVCAPWVVADIREVLRRRAKASLFGALLNKNVSTASLSKLMRRSDGHTGPAGFTTLHAAVLSRRTDALPALVAAGAPLDAALRTNMRICPWDTAGVSAFHEDVEFRTLAGMFQRERQLGKLLSRGDTALVVAVRCVCSAVPVHKAWTPPQHPGRLLPDTPCYSMGNEAAARVLLELGADPNAGSRGGAMPTAVLAAIEDSSSSSPSCLKLLLSCRRNTPFTARWCTWPGFEHLPFDLAVLSSDGRSLLGLAAVTAVSSPAKVRLLHEAGARLTAADLLHAIDRLCAPGVAALLAAGTPAVDMRRPGLSVCGMESYSCPIHRALHAAVGLLMVCTGGATSSS
jgi:hypothetical protein